ncbi:hypothetical protein HY251_14045, partial [bacterium]|nr:hypothetical protein [bacterium]
VSGPRVALAWRAARDAISCYIVLRAKETGPYEEIARLPSSQLTFAFEGSPGVSRYCVVALAESGLRSEPSNGVRVALPASSR